ncbi:MAG: hypothetical protein GX282_03550 [Campylobacteraceae bacterium]|nr:hypothetical protein [Campylobacteraceae bacterium]
MEVTTNRVNLTFVGVPSDKVETIKTIFNALNIGLKLDVNEYKVDTNNSIRKAKRDEFFQNLGAFSGDFTDDDANSLREKKALDV